MIIPKADNAPVYRNLEETLIQDIIKEDVSIFSRPKEAATLSILNKHRAKMHNWMIQVLRVFKKSTPKTYFLAVSIIDRYLEKKRLEKPEVVIDKKDLHLTTLTSIFISSKMEDIKPIYMK